MISTLAEAVGPQLQQPELVQLLMPPLTQKCVCMLRMLSMLSMLCMLWLHLMRLMRLMCLLLLCLLVLHLLCVLLMCMLCCGVRQYAAAVCAASHPVMSLPHASSCAWCVSWVLFALHGLRMLHSAPPPFAAVRAAAVAAAAATAVPVVCVRLLCGAQGICGPQRRHSFCDMMCHSGSSVGCRWASIPDNDKNLIPLLECLTSVVTALSVHFQPYAVEESSSSGFVTFVNEHPSLPESCMVHLVPLRIVADHRRLM